jgi:hypothetical protein
MLTAPAGSSSIVLNGNDAWTGDGKVAMPALASMMSKAKICPALLNEEPTVRRGSSERSREMIRCRRPCVMESILVHCTSI